MHPAQTVAQAAASALCDVPLFAAAANSIEAIDSPLQFRSLLSVRSALCFNSHAHAYQQDQIRAATHRIILATLYLGTSETELIHELHAALANNPNLHLHVLVDRFRGTRTDAHGQSSAKIILESLKNAFPRQVQLLLYQSPAADAPWLDRLPQRFNEVFGLQHMKAYVFDDNVVVGGANLSSDYFVNRQDRYVLVRNSQNLADYFADLVETVSKLSEKDSSKDSSKESAIEKTSNALNAFNSSWRNRTKQTHQQLMSSFSSQKVISGSANLPCTFIAPAIQLGVAGIRFDEQATIRALQIAASNPSFEITLASGYLNLPQQYINALIKSKNDIRILCSSPQANGFYNSRGVSRFIPTAYSYLELLFAQEFASRSAASLQLLEYIRPGWTWHAKGLWITTSSSNSFQNEIAMTAVGSSNFNYRSLNRDLEAQLFIVTRNRHLQSHLQKNLNYLCEHTQHVSISDLRRRNAPVLVRACARLMRSMF